MRSSNASAGSASSGGSVEAQTFASFLELRKDPNCRPPVVIHPQLLTPTWCRHCKRLEDLRPARSPMRRTSAGEQPAVSFPDAGHDVVLAEDVVPLYDLDIERRTCFRCAEEIYQTRHLQYAIIAGSGGDTPLHLAARSRNLRMLCHLLTLVGEDCAGGHGRVVQLLRRRNDREETALHVAVSVGGRDMVELMLWVDPNLARIRCQGTSPMYLAVSQGRGDIAQALHDGAHAVLSYSGPSEQNALHAAVLQGETLTKMLLAWNKDLSKKKDENGSTPLHFAVSMVQRRPRVGILCFRFKFSWVKNAPTWHLLDADASVAFERDGQGLFPVHVAAMTNRWDAIWILITRCPGCIGLRDNKGRTFLHLAVKNWGLIVVRRTCSRSELAPIMNIQDKDGNTALHVAVKIESLEMVCALLRNKEVCLNLRNNEGQTALDIAKSKIRRGFFFAGNPDNVIYITLILVGARHGSSRWDHIQRNRIPDSMKKHVANKKEPPDDLTKQESEKMTSSTQTLGIGAVLIATVTFGATFTLPGGNIADDHLHGGSPTLSGRWYFDAFMVANTLAFICATSATAGLMYSGMAMVSLPFRRTHFNISLGFAMSSVTSLTVAFALGVYMVLAPVARPTAIAICAISPLVVLYRNVQDLWMFAPISGPLRARRGFWSFLMLTVRIILIHALFQFWPFAVIFGCAAHLRHRRHG